MLVALEMFPSGQTGLRCSQTFLRTSSALSRRVRPRSSPFRQKSSATARNKAQKSKTPRASTLPNNAGAYESDARRLGSRQSSTLLYQTGSHWPYILGCYFVGGGLIAAAGHNYYVRSIADYREVPRFVPIAITVGCIFMVAYGSYVCLKPQNMIRRITSVPSSSVGLGHRSLLLQIERSRSIPFIKPRTITVPSTDVTISAPLFMGGEERIMAELENIRRRQEKANAFDPSTIYSLPFRQMGFWIGRGIDIVKKTFTNHSFLQLHVKGHNISWKLEKYAAWSLDDGQALDKLVKVKIA